MIALEKNNNNSEKTLDQTTRCNTWSNSAEGVGGGLRVHPDWVGLTVHCDGGAVAVLPWLCEFLERCGRVVTLDLQPWGRLGYDGGAVFENGLVCYFSEGRRDVHIQASGEVCAALGLDVMHLVNEATNCGDFDKVNLTRFDWALDGLPFSVGWVKACSTRTEAISVSNGSRGFVQHLQLNREAVRTAAKSASFHVSGEGSTLYIGARTSPRMLRIYDAHGYVRGELEFKRDAAAIAFRALYEVINDDVQLASVSVALLRDFVDFTDPNHRVNVANAGRRRLAGWWSSFINGVQRVRLAWSVKDVTASVRAFVGYVGGLARMFGRYNAVRKYIPALPSLESLAAAGREKFKADDRRFLTRARIFAAIHGGVGDLEIQGF